MIKKPPKQLQQVLQGCKRAVLYVGLFSLFINLLMLTLPIYMLQLFDRVLASYSADTLLYLTLIALIALGVLSLLDAARTRILIHTSEWLDNALSPQALMRMPDEILLGRSQAVQSLQDISQVRSFFCTPSVFALFDSPWSPIFLIVIYLLNVWLGVLATIGSIILLSLAWLNERTTREPLQKATTLSINNHYHVTATMRNAEVIQGMGMLANIRKKWQRENQAMLDQQNIASQRSSTVLAATKFFRVTIQMLMLGVGAYLVVKNQMTPGMMIAGSILLGRALAPLEQAIGGWKQFVNARQAYQRLIQHFSIDVKRSAGIQLPKPKGILSVEKAYYIPAGERKYVLEAVSFVATPGQVTAIIGASAAGKSTLARLIIGAIPPNAGKIRLDSADVFTWDRDDFGRYVGYLPQDVELFAGTVKENIARMGEIDDKAVIEATQLAGVHDMILRLPAGYDTEIQSLQYQLSGGQRQRIALARAVYGDPCLLVLDEPNSNLDTEGEQHLIKTIQTFRERGTTIILIAHRPSILSCTDQIMVLKEGKIQLSGSKEEILNKLISSKQKTHHQKGMPYGIG